jgi:hypothetical protein
VALAAPSSARHAGCSEAVATDAPRFLSRENTRARAEKKIAKTNPLRRSGEQTAQVPGNIKEFRF